MADLSTFEINKRWPAQNPELIQLYAFPTPNGKKIPFALEEMGLEYEYHQVSLSDTDVKSSEFLSLSPNNKIPAIIDPNGPDGEPLGLFESGAILIYLADKSGKFIGRNAHERYTVIQWLMFQMAGVGPMFGQLGFFYKYAGSKMEDPTARDRYINEAKRLLNVVNTQLEGQEWIAGEYSIADMALVPWLEALDFYGAKEVTDFDQFTNVHAYIERFNARPAIKKALERIQLQA
ncbi:glutathione S-transferase [Marivivens donghaensis]|uniref:Glutathione S-transferase n=1 Tax=Marivivens donghaensis TaxID=1699413 RepID=A0ABX0VSU1_9RHOB|nr:glutathione binding-like protein [Marivivens donghaensis]NIY71003.1 glutathione S-transferase [Marivivens donghaensis]